MAWMVGSATQVSVQSPARTIFFRPLFSIAATKSLSSQASIEVRSMGTWFGKTALILRPKIPAETLRFHRAEDNGQIKNPCSLRERDGVVDDRLAIRNSKRQRASEAGDRSARPRNCPGSAVLSRCALSDHFCLAWLSPFRS